MPSLKAIEVRLDVADVARNAAFYAEMLGFEVGTLLPPELPQFAILSRDGLRLQLGRRAEAPAPSSHAACTLWLDVTGVREMHSMVKQKAAVEWGPEVYSYHRREFAFRDPDGHLIILSELTADPPTCDGA